jgi:hypothetical protein
MGNVLTVPHPARPMTTRAVVLRRARRIALLLFALTVIVVALALYQLIDARNNLSAAARNFQEVATQSHHGNSLALSEERRGVEADLRQAHAQFDAASDDMTVWGPLMRRMGWMPGVGGELQAAPALADVGSDGSSAALDVLDGLGPVWPILSHNDRRGFLARVAPRLQSGISKFRSASSELVRATSQLDSVPSSLGNADWDSKLRTLRTLIPGMRAAADWLAAAPSLLGDSSTSHVLLVWENPSEERATGGFIPAANFISIAAGRVHPHPVGSYFPNQPYAPPPKPERLLTPESAFLFEDSNWSPDFPLTARYERWMFGRATGQWATTVLDVTGGAQDILAATKPIYLPRYKVRITSKNVGRYIELFHHNAFRPAYCHVGQKHPVGFLRGHPKCRAPASDTQSQRFLAALFHGIMHRAQSLNVAGLVRLGGGLRDAIHDQSLMLFSRNGRIAQAISEVGAGDRIIRPRTDSLFVVDDNRSYNKINPYVRERANYDVYFSPHAPPNAVVTLHYHLRPSPHLRGAGPWFGGFSKHDYQDYLRVYVPPTALVRTAPTSWPVLPAYGLLQLQSSMVLRPGSSRTLQFSYQLPSGIFAKTGPGTYALSIQREPDGNLHSVTVTLHGLQGVTIGERRQSVVSLPIHLKRRVNRISEALHGFDISPGRPVTRPAIHSDPYLSTRWFMNHGRHGF